MRILAALFLSMVAILMAFPVLAAGQPIGTPDGVGPELISISVDKTQVNAPGSVKIFVDAKDDISGIEDIQPFFWDEVHKRHAYGHVSYNSSAKRYEGTVSFNEYTPDSVYKLVGVDLVDQAENWRSYSNQLDLYEDAEMFEPNISIEVTSSDPRKADFSAPIVKNIRVSQQKVKAPGKVTVTGEISEENSGHRSTHFSFRERKGGYEIHGALFHNTGHDLYEDDFEVDQYVPSGIYDLDWVSTKDEAGNERYYEKNPGGEYAEKLPFALSLEVVNENPENQDAKAPVVTEISADRAEVEAPGSFKLMAKAEDDLSGAAEVQATFFCKENGKELESYMSYNENTGLFEEEVQVDQFKLSGIYELVLVQTSDNRDNERIYAEKAYGDNLGYPYEPLPFGLAVAVRNADVKTADVVTSTKAPELEKQIDDMTEGQTAHVFYGNGETMEKNVFSAIEGQNKTLSLKSKGVEWTFDGQKITQPKPVDLHTEVKLVKKSSSPDAGKIEKKLQGKNAIVVNFANNGELPGPANIRIKTDYAFRNALGLENLCVYYYDRTKNKLVLIAENLNADRDEYLGFTITHNSDYVVVKDGEIAAPEGKPTEIPELPQTGDSTSLMLSSFAMLVSGGAAIVMARKRKNQ